MGSAHDARRAVYVQADVASWCQGGFTGMQAYAHTDFHPFTPAISGKSALDRDCRRNSTAGTSKGYEEAIALRIDFVTMILLENRAQKVPARFQ
jgi:hypothetical protein